MFPTEVKSQCRTRPATTSSIRDRNLQFFFDDETFNAQKKLKQAKQKSKIAEKQYNDLLSNVNQLKRSIQVTKNRTCKKRLNFMKSFDAKKLKLHQYQLEHQKKTLDLFYMSDRKKKAKNIKVTNDLQIIVSKDQLNKTTQQLRQRNKTQKLNRRQIINAKRINEQMAARFKYQKQRDQQMMLRAKKQQIDVCLHTRAKINKYIKAIHERRLIQSYDKMLQQILQLGEDSIVPFSTMDQGSPSFFITNKQQLKQKQKQQRV